MGPQNNYVVKIGMISSKGETMNTYLKVMITMNDDERDDDHEKYDDDDGNDDDNDSDDDDDDNKDYNKFHLKNVTIYQLRSTLTTTICYYYYYYYYYY
jgi:ABC-type Zn2+ transport system substrate-binding protein/surface adhesin